MLRRSYALRKIAFCFLIGVLVVLMLTPTSDALSTTDFVVNSTGDLADTNPSDGVCDVNSSVANDQCTLRGAIQEANRHAGANNISFAIIGNGVKTIKLTSQLPMLTDQTGPTTIDGYTQPGSSPNTDPLASNARIMIQVEGKGYGIIDALPIWSPGNVVRGLAFFNLRDSIKLYGTNAHDNRVVGNFIGTDSTATRHAPKRIAYWASGVRISGGASNNIVGGTSAVERNVISGNSTHGVGLYDKGTSYNRIVGNVIGLAPSGHSALPNMAHGVDINGGASDNIVGGTSVAERNVISGNANEGVEVSHGRATYGFPTANKVIGNLIGTDLSGKSAQKYTRNGANGVHLQDGARATTVDNNFIVNSGLSGVGIEDSRTIDNEVNGNHIGVSLGGVAIPNGKAGVKIFAGAKGTQLGPDNVIANNPAGVQIDDADTDVNTIMGNSIYNNGKLGIDLRPLGIVNKNDPRDLDNGANQQQNFPVLVSARTSGGVTTIRGVLNSRPNRDFTLQFYSEARGTREGKTYMGERHVVTGGRGIARFAFRPVKAVRPGVNVTATATSWDGDTSEFSAARTVRRPS